MTRTLLCSLLCALLFGACVSRSEVGKELAPIVPDAGLDASTDAGSDASLSEDEKARDFENELLGSWTGVLDSTLGTLELTFHFRAGSSFTLCLSEECSTPGTYFVTDVLSNNHYAGELQSSTMDRKIFMDDMWIDRSKDEILRFMMYDKLFLSGTVELTRIAD